jgi:hypothetical protein
MVYCEAGLETCCSDSDHLKTDRGFEEVINIFMDVVSESTTSQRRPSQKYFSDTEVSHNTNSSRNSLVLGICDVLPPVSKSTY